METVPVSAAEDELSKLIHRANNGETIVIEAPSGERVRLEPVKLQLEDRVPGLLKGKIGVPARLFEPLTDDELHIWNGQ